ncbi:MULTISPECIES: ribosome maturation factor RimP [Prochlorococcus]|uniref:Ribosome maturation factor RimP n=1 Tax=Prochlorococcus marinus (strain SARG / CCMP1375 / SS120) TaxID=167539 RepID=RIMP_PROMA|nr:MULTISPECIES: ribosome maturation factor RimP [Prochlorococcus]Q7VA23.1 RecName: Full=Ribosome maturation factor RimP [Prochlorococcus marinus subsp. marinus str. CCMP1375]AAQ00690.1 Uncharacterized YhbC family conserved protein [Prochlorococcus marinus subsp. marinus str. CCMP1375]KGG10814.1 hypothetical protein EV04_1775 [Prochlorococcus marinus str. LG]KGG20392.1 hypothetical protein EV08_0975 [Prochlorococcus marinus str. SS2]KGG24061.1 hypothetical protein EV09_0665 [Prochlorococcus ma
MQKHIVKDLELLAANAAAKEGFEIIRLEVLAQMKPMKIQLQIRHKNGSDVSLEDCSRLSRPIGEVIENSKLINQSYILEISSPGLSDILETDKEFATFKGFPIQVSTKNKSNSTILQNGLLHTKSKEHLLINIKGKMSKIPIDNVIQVRLASPTD